ncbi:MAG: 5-(carboxyamino)imidazole ribonucleotide synthase [Chroococcidiopsidaceae cyanobacterium CP_BM_RX_35]|nr:5-(carboxyamino)imidazole ribonucleotide synthase [Chroococcidiopsidaceae cyanobacterium CP_BM_RX_35]
MLTKQRIGVVGGGQLAWMMASAAERLGIDLVVQTPSPDDPAVAIAADTIFAPVNDAAATAEMATRCDAITFENEFVNLEALSTLAEQGVCFRPGLRVLAPLLDKYHQRCYLRDLGLPVPRFIDLEEMGNSEASRVGGYPDLSGLAGDPLGIRGKWGKLTSLTHFGFPAVLKARRHGYDGQGTFIIKDIDALQHRLAVSHKQQVGYQPLFLLEEFVPFERELAVVAARSTAGEVVTFPVVETQQEEQVCRRVLVPADITNTITVEIEAIAHTLLQGLQAVGVFGIELFLTANGSVLVNEISPRTHNSGHFTIDACETSQFEQHLRAVCDLPLGNPALRCGGAVMVNLLGYENSSTSDYAAQLQQLEQIPQARVYWYGKTESRPGRKLGHVTVLLDAQNREQETLIAQKVESIWYNR